MDHQIVESYPPIQMEHITNSAEPEAYKLVLERYNSIRVSDETNIEPPIPVIKINKEPVATNGNMITISGAPKSAKTAVSSGFLAGSISRDGDYEGFEGIEVQPNPDGKAVIHFDTEQAKHQQQKNLKSILKRVGMDKCPDYFLSYNLRQLSIKESKKAVWEICEASHKAFNGIKMIVVDGIADFTRDVNDPVSSTRIVKFFEKVATVFNTVVPVIVHTNPGSSKERGHLGSELQRKSESVLSVIKEGDASYLKAKYLRTASNSDVPSIQFVFDKAKGYHVTSGIRSVIDEQARIEEIQTLVNQVFGNGEEYKYSDAIQAIMDYTGRKDRWAKDKFTLLKNSNLIIQGSDKLWKLSIDDELEEIETEIRA